MCAEDVLSPVVLHVEDDPFHRDLLKMALEEHCEVIHAPTIEDAIIALQRETRIRFVLLDGNLPTTKGNCFESSVLFFKDHLHHRSDIVVITATCDDKIRKELVSLGCVNAEKYDAWKCVVERLPFVS